MRIPPGGLKLTDYVLNNPDGISFEEVLAEYVPWAGGANPSVATNEYFKGGETWPVCLDAAAGLINYVPETVWPPFSSVYSAEDATEMASIKTEQENYMKEWRAYFITGQRDIDADWDEYVAGYDGMNTPSALHGAVPRRARDHGRGMIPRTAHLNVSIFPRGFAKCSQAPRGLTKNERQGNRL